MMEPTFIIIIIIIILTRHLKDGPGIAALQN
jgi:hypothetical protein